MNAENTKAAQQAVKDKVNTANEKINEHVNKIQNSKIGRKIPLKFEKIELKQIALVGIVLNTVLEFFLFSYLSAFTVKELNVGMYRKIVRFGYIGCAAAGLALELFAYFKRKGSMTFPFVAIRGAVVVLSVLLVLGAGAEGLFHHVSLAIVALGILLGQALYTYVFALYLLGAPGAESESHV